ncbi:MAG: TPM domain-containing protein, partial [Jiangellaceae bacterium]
DPVDIETQITDQVDALGDRRGELEAALAQLDADHQLQLFVVYVESFAGLNAEDWANETANRNSFGFNDALLAIATGDREFGDSFDPDYPLTDNQLTEVANVAIEPPLRENDWAGAAIGAAEGYAAGLDGEPIPEPDITPGEADPSSDGISWWVSIVAVAGVGAVGVFAYTRSRQRRQATSTASSQRSAPE